MPMTAEQRARLVALVGDANAAKVTDDNAVGVLLSYGETVRQEYIDADAQVTALSAKMTTLSAAAGDSVVQADPEVLLDRADSYESRIELSVRDGDMPKFMADLVKPLVKKGDQPNAFMLSRADGINQRPIDLVLGLFKGAKLGVTGGVKTPTQVLPRKVSDATNLSAAGGGGESEAANPLKGDLDKMFPDGK